LVAHFCSFLLNITIRKIIVNGEGEGREENFNYYFNLAFFRMNWYVGSEG